MHACQPYPFRSKHLFSSLQTQNAYPRGTPAREVQYLIGATNNVHGAALSLFFMSRNEARNHGFEEQDSPCILILPQSKPYGFAKGFGGSHQEGLQFSRTVCWKLFSTQLPKSALALVNFTASISL